MIPSFAALNDPFLFWTLAIICTMCVGFAKSGVVGTGILAIPLMAFIFPPRESTGILLPILVMGDIIAVVHYRKHAEWKHIIRAMPWAFVGIIIGWILMKSPLFPQNYFKVFIGATVIAVLALGEWMSRTKSEDALHIPHSTWFSAIIGITGGITTMMANAAGPVFAIYLIALNLPKKDFIGTTAWIFLILNTVKIPFSIHLGFISYESILFNLSLLPAVLIGSWIGAKTVNIIPQKSFSFLIKFFAILAGIKLIFF